MEKKAAAAVTGNEKEDELKRKKKMEFLGWMSRRKRSHKSVPKTE
jgi:hypothetical protein